MLTTQDWLRLASHHTLGKVALVAMLGHMTAVVAD